LEAKRLLARCRSEPGMEAHMHNYKPADHPDVSIYMMASEAEGVIDFAKKVLRAEEAMRLAREDGSIMHAELRIGDSIVMLSQATKEFSGFPIWLHVYVPDVDATYREALEYRATSAQAPVTKGDTDKRGGVIDGSGNTWWIATAGG